jgi:hypothetical protein
MEIKHNTLPVKKIYYKILEQFSCKKSLLKKWHTAFNRICKKSEFKKELFTYTYYEYPKKPPYKPPTDETIYYGYSKETIEHPKETITIAEVTYGRTWVIYTNLITGIGRITCFNEFNEMEENHKYRILKVKQRKMPGYKLQLETFYRFQVAFFETYDLSFNKYAKAILKTPPNNNALDFFGGQALAPFPFMAIEDGTKNLYPCIKWKVKHEIVQVTKLNDRIEILLDAFQRVITSVLVT